MNIFDDIKRLIFETDNKNLGIHGEHEEKILAFLATPNACTADDLFKFIQVVHQKEGIFNLMNALQLYERGLADILPDQREHFYHSASVYVLGLAIFNNCQPIRIGARTTRHPFGDVHLQKSSFLFRWSLAACLHDIAYPLELALKSFNIYTKKLKIFDSENSFLCVSSALYKKLNFLPILQPESNLLTERKDTSLGLIAQFLTNDGGNRCRITYETLLQHLTAYVEDGLAIGRIDHGVFSALIILKTIHELYEKHPEFNVENYYHEVVDASTAAFLHNAYRYAKLAEIYSNGIFRYDYPSGLGYLLYVCDSFCEWLREANSRPEHFRINATNESLELKTIRKYEARIAKAKEILGNDLPVNIEVYKLSDLQRLAFR
jgi:hypothetical protein